MAVKSPRFIIWSDGEFHPTSPASLFPDPGGWVRRQQIQFARPHSARDNLPPYRDGDLWEWDILSIDSAELVCDERLGGVVKSFVRRAA